MTRVGAMVAVGVILAMATPIVSAQADPLPAFCTPAIVADNVCTATLTSVTADVVNGTITGTPVGGGVPVTLAGQADAYLESKGFDAPLPEAIQEWDTQIDQTSNLSTDPADPNWYGNAKAVVFLPRTLNEIATRFPPDVLDVRFTTDGAQPGAYRLVSIQPSAQ